VAGLGILCLLYGHFLEPYWIEVSSVTIHTPKLAHASFCIVQISDLHCDSKARNEKAMVRIVNDLQPDIIVATGDYLNHPSALPRLRNSLRRLNAPLGKFAVTGNFETLRSSPPDVLEGTGFRQLNRETVAVTKGAESIGILGIDFASCVSPLEAVKGLPVERFNVFLFHTPELIEEVCGPGVDLYLCGDTHGGQVALPLYGALTTFSKFGKKYESGLYHVEGTTVYVNRGLGMSPCPRPQIRFFARPEITVFHVLPEQ
jgi:predicted MPP superfamily phosphohydrolase